MNKTLSVVTMLLFAASVFAADVPSPPPATTPTVKTKKRSAAEADANEKQQQKAQRDARIKATKKTAAPDTPLDESVNAAKAQKLKERNKAAKENTTKTTTPTK